MTIEYENAQHTSHAPDAVELARIGPGYVVKICARGKPEVENCFGERFWVLVHSVDGDTITGQVDNHVMFHSLEFGEVITFKAENVYQIDGPIVRH